MAATPKGKTPETHKSPPAKPAATKKAAGKAAPVAIYALSDPRTGEVRYIGKANNPCARLKSHIRDSRRRNTPVYCWIRHLHNSGIAPVMSVMEWAQDWREAEKRQISAHRANGARLLNVADGGDEPFCSTEQRKRNGANSARKRDKTTWAVRRMVGQLRHQLAQAGCARHVELMDGIQRLFDVLTPQQQKAFGRRIGVAA